ncbi:MAG TPA: hypothetical protein VMS96_01915 [Terriglobales bacterium]|nr:hypothetical protein [Terriglobales bacterium]
MSARSLAVLLSCILLVSAAQGQAASPSSSTAPVLYVHIKALHPEDMVRALESLPEVKTGLLRLTTDSSTADITASIEKSGFFLHCEVLNSQILEKREKDLYSGSATEGLAEATAWIAREAVLLSELAKQRKAPPDAAAASPLTIAAESRTVYLKSEVLARELANMPALSQSGYKLVSDPKTADFILVVTRPFLTYDWEYQITDRVTGARVGGGMASAHKGEEAASLLAADVAAKLPELRAARTAARMQIDAGHLASKDRPGTNSAMPVHSLRLQSKTVYLEDDLLRASFKARPEYASWGLMLVTEPSDAADASIEVTRPFLTFDWRYKIVHHATGKELQGKIVASDGGRAAPLLAEAVMRKLRESAVLPLPLGLANRGATEAGAKKFDVQFAFGNQATKRPRTITLEIGKEWLVGRTGKDTLFSIPLAAIINVAHDVNVRHRKNEWMQFWDSFNVDAGSNCGDGCLGALLVVLTGMGIQYSGGALIGDATVNEHFISIAWRDQRIVHNLVLKTNDKHYADLLNALQLATAGKLIEIEAARKAMEAKLAALPASGRIKVNNDVMLGLRSLPAGVYDVLLIPRQANLAELYLRPSNSSAVAGQALVEKGTLDLPVKDPEVLYRNENGLKRVSEVRIGEMSLKFTPAPLVPQELAEEGPVE